MSNQITLWIAKVCPYAHRARIAIKEKKLNATIKEEDLSNITPELTAVYKKATFSDPTSNGKVPVIQHGDIIFTQSDLIAWYIAQTFPNQGNPLLPKSTFQVAKVRYFLNQIGMKIPGIFFSYLGYNKSNGDKQAQVDKAVREYFQKLNANIVGPYVLGQQYSLADLMIWPWFDRWVAIQHYIKTDVKPKNFENIVQWIDAMSQREAIKQTNGQSKLYIELTKKFFGDN